MNPSEIENALRLAPQPTAPPGLKQRLATQASACLRKRAALTVPVSREHGTWLSRWWPALGPAAISLACAAVFTVQQMEIRNLEKAIQPAPASTQAVDEEPAVAEALPGIVDPANPADADQAEIARLEGLVATLGADVSRLEQIQAENVTLRAQLAGAAATTLTPEEMQRLEETRAKAMSIQCVNNLKQLGLAVRVWAVDNGDVTPPDVLSMTNELSTPKILACPADTAHPAATGGWTGYSGANCSYEYLAPSAPDSSEPNRVLFRCPVHGHIALCDGSVHAGIAKEHPERLVQGDGKLYLRTSLQ